MSGTFQNLYESAWHHPGVAFVGAGLCGLFVLGRRARFTDGNRTGWGLLFLLMQVEILLDASLTGALSPLHRDGRLFTSLLTAAGILFVILGDLRYFYLVERQRDDGSRRSAQRGGREGSRFPALLRAFQVALVVPVATGVAQALAPRLLSGNRLFLVYELALLALLGVHYRWRVQAREGGQQSGPRRKGRGQNQRDSYVRRLFLFELAQYGLWVVADLLILSGSDVGWALRLLPNALYYGAFVPVALLGAPREARA